MKGKGWFKMGASATSGGYISSSAQIADDVIAAADLAIPTTKGGLIAYSTAPIELAVGTDTKVLTADSTQPTGLKWENVATPVLGSGNILVHIFEPDSVDVGSWTENQNGAMFFGGDFECTSTINNEVNYKVDLIAGTYDAIIIHSTTSGSGILNLSTTDGSWGTLDMYSGSGVNNVISKLTGMTISTAGVQNLQLLLATKNGSSSGYQAFINAIYLIRTA